MLTAVGREELRGTSESCSGRSWGRQADIMQAGRPALQHGLAGVLCNGCMSVQGCEWPDRIPRVSPSDSSRAQDHSGKRA